MLGRECKHSRMCIKLFGSGQMKEGISQEITMSWPAAVEEDILFKMFEKNKTISRSIRRPTRLDLWSFQLWSCLFQLSLIFNVSCAPNSKYSLTHYRDALIGLTMFFKDIKCYVFLPVYAAVDAKKKKNSYIYCILQPLNKGHKYYSF